MNHTFTLSSKEEANYDRKKSEIEVYLSNGTLVISAIELDSKAFHACVTADYGDEGCEVSTADQLEYIIENVAWFTEEKIEKREFTFIPE